MSLFSFPGLFLPVEAGHLYRKGFINAFLTSPWGTDASIIRLVTIAHSGLLGEKFKYAFSQMISIVSFWALRSSKFRPPSVMGLFSVLLVIRGEESPSHIKLLIILFRVSEVSFGMP